MSQSKRFIKWLQMFSLATTRPTIGQQFSTNNFPKTVFQKQFSKTVFGEPKRVGLFVEKKTQKLFPKDGFPKWLFKKTVVQNNCPKTISPTRFSKNNSPKQFPMDIMDHGSHGPWISWTMDTMLHGTHGHHGPWMKYHVSLSMAHGQQIIPQKQLSKNRFPKRSSASRSE